MLATSNGDLKDIFLWDLYNRGAPGPIEDQNSHTPDMILSAPKDYEVENMRWTSSAYQLYTTVREANGAESYALCIYDLPEGQGAYTNYNGNGEESQRTSKVKKSVRGQQVATQNIKLPLNISYLCLNENDKNIIYGTNDTRKFYIDLREANKYHLFKDESGDTPLTGKEDAMVEYNQNNYITFANRLQKSILIYDIRQVS